MSEKVSLYNITEEISALETLFELDMGEVSEDLEQLEAELSNSIKSKTDSCIGFLNMQKDKASLFATRIAEMSKAKTVIENKIERFEQYLLTCVSSTEKKELSGQFSKIKLRKPSKVVLINDENKVPMEFLKSKTTTSVDKAGIKAMLKTGETVDGCELVNGKQSLNITLNS